MKHAFTLLVLLAVLCGLSTPTQAQTTALPSPLPLPAQAIKRASARQAATVLNATTATTIRYVKAGASGNGSSWSSASGDLQAMINASASGDQVWMAGGTYKPSTAGLGNARNAAFSLKNGVSVLGGFTGTAGTEGNVSTRTAIPSSTTLSGDIGAVGDNSDNSYHVFDHSANSVNSTAILDGATITGGNANGDISTPAGRGGGMLNAFGNIPTITNCLFTQNSASVGGAIDNEAASFTLTNCSFVGNSAALGAGVYAASSSGTLINCYFYQNTASGSGGGVVFQSTASTSNLTNCTFRSNSSPNGGGGAAITEANITLTNCITWSNGGQNSLIILNSGGYSASYSLIEAGSTSYTNGGNNQTLTSSPFETSTGPALSKCAPAVDAGNDAANTTTTDVLGNTRKLRTIDIGAAEYQGAPYVAPTLITYSSTATTVCAGTRVTFTFDITTGADGVTAGSFYRDNTNLGDADVSVAPNRIVSFRRTFSISQSGTYQIVVVSACSSLTTTFPPITVNPLPTPFSVTGGGAYCAGGGSVVGLSGSQIGVNYRLIQGSNAMGAPVTGTGNPISFAPQSTTGTYTVRATNATTACTQTMSGSAVVSVNALPTVSITPAATTICAGQSTVLTASGADTYRWNTAQTTASISVSAVGPYSVTGTSTATGCSNTATATVTVTPLSDARFTGLPASVCIDAGPSTLTPATPGGTFAGPGISGNTFSPATVGAGGPYSITYTISNQGCPNSSVQMVTVKPLPQAPAITTQSGQPYPGGVSSLTLSQNTGNVILMVSGCAGGTITWSGGSATTLAVSTATTGVFSIPATCTQNGCTSPAATATITVVPTTLRVLYRDADFGNTTNNIIKPYFQLSNAGNQAIPYGEVTVRYWFTSEGGAPPTNLAVYYAQPGPVNMKYVALAQPRQGALGYIEYSFPGGGSLGTGGNSGPVENGVQKTDGSNFDESDDYSYQANYADYLLNSRMTAYRKGADGVPVIFWGQEPAQIASQTAVQGYSQARDNTVTSQIQTRVEVRNTGNVALPVAGLKVRYYFTSDNGQTANVYVDYADMGAANVQARVVRLAAPVSGADSYVELTFPGNTMQLGALSSLGAIDFRLVRSDFGLFDQSNDYSFAANYGSVGLNNRIPVYLNNQLIFGTPPAGAPARIGVGEPASVLSVRVLGNPVVSGNAEVEISGAGGQAVSLKLVDLQGRPIHEQRIEQAGETEQVSLPLGNSRGQLLLKVSTNTQQQSLKLLRP